MARFDSYTEILDSELAGPDKLGVWDFDAGQFKNITIEEIRQWLMVNSGDVEGHLANTAVHFNDVGADDQAYLRSAGGWVPFLPESTQQAQVFENPTAPIVAKMGDFWIKTE